LTTIKPAYNPVGLINCLPASPDIETNLLLHDKGFAGHGLQPGLFYLRIQRSMR